MLGSNSFAAPLRRTNSMVAYPPGRDRSKRTIVEFVRRNGAADEFDVCPFTGRNRPKSTIAVGAASDRPKVQ